MDFHVPEELAALRDSFAGFLDREVRPIEESVTQELESPDPEHPAVARAAQEVVCRSSKAGFYAAHMPETAGGWGVSTLGTTLLVEDAARSGLRLGVFAIAPPNPSGPTPLLLELPEHLWETYVRPLIRAEKTMCFALTEPEAGSDAQSIRTRARRDGDSWVIDGHKHYITNADKADFAIVFAVTAAEDLLPNSQGGPERSRVERPRAEELDPPKATSRPQGRSGAREHVNRSQEAPQGRRPRGSPTSTERADGGITAFCVPRDQYSLGKKQHTIAETHPSEIFLDGARVPADHVLGEPGQGFLTAMRFLNAGRAYIGAQCLGLAEYCLDQAVAHAKRRTAFGKPLAKFQGVSFPLADSKAEIEAMRWLTYHLAWAVDQGEQPILDASIVKYYDTERAYDIADRCLQVFGGMGLLREGPIEHVLRYLRIMRIVEGASEVQKLVISRSLGL